jgi:hypothetical protein
MLHNCDYETKVVSKKHEDIVKLKESLGIESDSLNVEIPDHELKNSKIVNRATSRVGVIEKIFKQWYGGYYIVLLVNYNNSHDVVMWDNVNNTVSYICSMIHMNKSLYSIMN